jgi:hypothetical protein
VVLYTDRGQIIKGKDYHGSDETPYALVFLQTVFRQPIVPARLSRTGIVPTEFTFPFISPLQRE